MLEKRGIEVHSGCIFSDPPKFIATPEPSHIYSPEFIEDEIYPK